MQFSYAIFCTKSQEYVPKILIDNELASIQVLALRITRQAITWTTIKQQSLKQENGIYVYIINISTFKLNSTWQ